jgi:hypothetical protein
MSQFLNGLAVFGLLVALPLACIAAVEYAVDTYCNSLPPTPNSEQERQIDVLKHSLSKT